MTQVALVVGEALVDVVHRSDGSVTEFPGGSAANVAVALARLDRPVWFDTCFADDHFGGMLRTHLDAAGVRLAGDPGASVSHSSSAVATIGADGAASYVFDIDWRLTPLTLPEEVVPVVVHTSSYGAALPPGADDVLAAVRAVRPTATVSYDVNARPAVTGVGADVRARVQRLAAVSDVLKASDEDLESLYPEHTVDAAAAYLLSLGPAVVVVTRGGDGASWVSRTGEGSIESVPVTVADTIGAGDTFGAGLIDALWTRDLLGAEHRDRLRELPPDDWAAILAFAASAAAVTVSRPGADPPYRHELET
jgi:fructokinase